MVCPLRKVLPAGILCDFTLPMPVMRAFNPMLQVDRQHPCAHTNNTWYKFIVNVFLLNNTLSGLLVTFPHTGLPSVDCSETPDEFTFIRFST